MIHTASSYWSLTTQSANCEYCFGKLNRAWNPPPPPHLSPLFFSHKVWSTWVFRRVDNSCLWTSVSQPLVKFKAQAKRLSPDRGARALMATWSWSTCESHATMLPRQHKYLLNGRLISQSEHHNQQASSRDYHFELLSP
jgi:hypothetical protein